MLVVEDADKGALGEAGEQGEKREREKVKEVCFMLRRATS